jgi:hypothetical protein
MRAGIVDLRYRMKDVLRALDRNEEVSILYHGKLKGVIRPLLRPTEQKVTDHPFFNMCPSEVAVEDEMDRLRRGRCIDL